MKRHNNFTSLVGLLVVAAYMGLTGFRSQQTGTPPQQLYFPETGHLVRDPFVAYFIQTGGVVQYGYPITDDYVDPSTKLIVQYFQQVRFEWHPGNSEPYKVQLGLLGAELGKQMGPVPISQMPQANDPNCRVFYETGHSLCYVFLDYWLQRGGLDRFGYPISEFTMENGLTIQYFQRARMEWHPEKPQGQRVQLAPLGLTYYNYAHFDPSRLSPYSDSAHPREAGVTTLHGRASVLKSIAAPNSAQAAYVLVTDQFGHPVSGAAVTLIIHFPQGPQSYTLPPTNAGGTTYQAFILSKVDPGAIVPMDFVLSYPGLADAQTRTSCMVWY